MDLAVHITFFFHQGHAITKPTKPNVTQVSAESVVIHWKLKPLQGEDATKPLVPVKFYKIQFREFLSGASGDGSGKRRSAWHTLDEVIGADARAFEILGLHTDRRYRFRKYLHTSYLTDSYIIFTLKMESVSKNAIFGLKLMVKSGLEKNILKSLHL